MHENLLKFMIYAVLISCFNLPLLFRSTRLGHP
nr:MAG TPA: hypothetical protein [Caudoviricetes sp.]